MDSYTIHISEIELKKCVVLQIMPFRVWFKCGTKVGLEIEAVEVVSHTGSSIDLMESTRNEFIW